MHKRYLSPLEAAKYLGIGRSTLNIHRMSDSGPPYIKWGANVRYDIRDLDEWMGRHRVQTDGGFGNSSPPAKADRAG